jgi:cyclopropane fatty-acyl-phospholipid synthase-like methyltransferase
MKNWFATWFDSPYYHTLYKNRTDDEAMLFVKNCVAHFQFKENIKLLDLACGKGRHSIAFSKYNLDVTGVDLSPQSIAHAQQFETDKLHFYVHDMRNIFRTNYYDVVCNLFTSFGYFNSNHDNYLAAKSMAIGLKKGGTLIVDFVNQQHARNNITNNQNETQTIDNIEFDIKRSYTENQLIKDIHITDGENKFHFQEAVNSFSLEQMIAIFEEEGLKHKETFGNYHFEKYDANESPRMILVFEK